MGRRPPLSSSDSLIEICEVSKGQKKTSVHVFQFKIGQAMDFDRASITLPAIHSKTSAKVLKRIGMSKKIKEILAHPNYICLF